MSDNDTAKVTLNGVTLVSYKSDLKFFMTDHLGKKIGGWGHIEPGVPFYEEIRLVTYDRLQEHERYIYVTDKKDLKAAYAALASLNYEMWIDCSHEVNLLILEYLANLSDTLVA